jgi:hypothetical protein
LFPGFFPSVTSLRPLRGRLTPSSEAAGGGTQPQRGNLCHTHNYVLHMATASSGTAGGSPGRTPHLGWVWGQTKAMRYGRGSLLKRHIHPAVEATELVRSTRAFPARRALYGKVDHIVGTGNYIRRNAAVDVVRSVHQ